MRWPLLSLLLLCSVVLHLGESVQDEVVGAAVEPPRRLRVTVGDESIVVALGGPPVMLADGRPVLVAAMPTRVFSGPGSFTFEYAEGWRHSGSIGTPTAVDAWWTLGGERSNVYLRRHGEDALGIRDTYADNMEKAGRGTRRSCSLTLDGRKLEGHAVSFVQGGMHGYPSQQATQYVFGWKESDTTSWLLVFSRYVPLKKVDFVPAELILGELPKTPIDQKKPSPADPATKTRNILEQDPELRVVLDTLRWAR